MLSLPERIEVLEKDLLANPPRISAYHESSPAGFPALQRASPAPVSGSAISGRVLAFPPGWSIAALQH